MRTTRTAALALFLLAGSASAATFYNPIVSAGQDPSVVQYNGYYYLAQSINSDTAIAVVTSTKGPRCSSATGRPSSSTRRAGVGPTTTASG